LSKKWWDVQPIKPRRTVFLIKKGITMTQLAAIVLETFDAVARITLNRPEQLNALNDQLMNELGAALLQCDADPAIGAIIITGSDKAFAAGADIKAMAQLDFETAYAQNFITRNWDTIATIRKPVIAAVAGFALGGGCELAMACDIIIAADNAQFGQPEIKLGVIPGAGGTQRLTRAIGKAKAMDMVLTGRMMDAAEAERAGLVARIVPLAELNEQALKMATTIAKNSRIATLMAKETVNAAFEQNLAAGLQFERRAFHSLFGTHDQREGMAAFIEKRKAVFKK
jgi:enoyl-CoA hydratase